MKIISGSILYSVRLLNYNSYNTFLKHILLSQIGDVDLRMLTDITK